MKKYIIPITTILILFYSTLMGQQLNYSLRNSFYESFSFLPEYQKKAGGIFLKEGVGLLVGSIRDTLNMNELNIPEDSLRLVEIEIDEKTGTFKEVEQIIPKPISLQNPQLLSCNCSKNKDSLKITISIGFRYAFGLEINVLNNSISVKELNYADKSENFKLNIDDKFSNYIEIPGQIIHFSLDGLDYKNSKEIFGSIEYKTNPYFEKNADFSNGYINIFYKRHFLFRCTPKIKLKRKY